jgi:hypothetical protein
VSEQVPEPELVPGLTAAQWDARSQVLRLAAVLVIPLGALLATLGLPIPVLLWGLGALFLLIFIASLVLGQVSLRVMRHEMQAGYSTMYDFAGYDLRDARTLELLRSREVEPAESGRVRGSLVANLLRPKPGTMLYNRNDDDPKR